MMSSAYRGVFFLGVSAVLLLGACASHHKPAPAQPAATLVVEDEAPRIKTSVVSASAIVSRCPDGRRMNGKLAGDVIQQLVAPCASVPGGRAHFSASLLPGGRIELAAPDGNPGEGVVPTCVLRHGLTHKILLKSACTFDVQLEQRSDKPGT